MSERIEQRGLELLVSPRGFGLAGAIECGVQLLIKPLDFRRLFCASAVRRSARDASSPATMAVPMKRDEGDPVVGIFDFETERRQEVVGQAPAADARPGARAPCPRIARRRRR